MVNHRKRRRYVLLSAAALIAAALGGSSSAAGARDSADGRAGHAVSEAGGGGTIVVASQRPITTLDPHGDMGGDLGTQLAGRAIFERLVGVSAEGAEPELASEWTVNEDASEWTFMIREEAMFTDGTPVTADDVVASIERIQRLEGPLAGTVADITVTTPDAQTAVFTAETPTPELLGVLNNIWIVPAAHADEEGFFNEPIGSGPFIVESFTPEGTLSLSPNTVYWGGAPDMDSLEIQFIPEIAARLTALRTGEADLTWGVPDDQVQGLRDEGTLTLEAVASNATYTMWFNSSREAFADAGVRRALWQAVNFEEIIAALYPETGQLADSIIAPPVLGYAPQTPVEYDPDAARAALEAANFDFDATYELQLRGSEFREFAQAVASNMRDIGVNVEPVEKEPGVWIEDLLALNWDINLQSLSLPSLDAATNVGRLYPCAAERTGYCNEELDELLAEAGSVADAEQREALYAEAIGIIWNDAVGMYPMFPMIIYAWDSELTGVDLDPSSIPGFAELSRQGS